MSDDLDVPAPLTPDDSRTADNYRTAWLLTRERAIAAESERDGFRRLLNMADGLLGLAVYRNEHDEQWKNEARELIGSIRQGFRDLFCVRPGVL